MAVIRTAAGMPAAVLRSKREPTAELDRIEGYNWRTYESPTDTIPRALQQHVAQRLARLTRQTLAFSNKLANHIGAIWFFFYRYNAALAV